MQLIPHPQNDVFNWQNRTAQSGLLNNEQMRQWNEEGYFLLQDVIEPDTIAALIEAIDPFDDKAEAFLKKNGGIFGCSL